MEHSIPAVHAVHLAELLARWRVSKDELLGPLGLTEDALAAPDARLSVNDVEALVGRAVALSGEPALGVYFGLQMRVSAHGYLGFAAMTAADVRGALALALRFAPTRTLAIALRVEDEAGHAALVVEERADFGAARDSVIFALLVGIWQIAMAITGRSLAGRAELALPEPPYFARVARFVPEVRFDRSAHRLVFDPSVLDLPLVMADAGALRLAREQLERELDAVGKSASVAYRVRTLLPKDGGGFRSLEEVAATMHVSPRTLKRRLAEDGASYTALLEDEQRERAQLLLRSRELSVDEIADRLGYSDVANFTRAFRRWTGMTPTAYRRARTGA